MPVDLKKISMSNVKDIIYVLSVIIAVVFFFRDKARNEAIIETKLNTVIENQNNQLEWMKQSDAKFELNAREHGTMFEHIRTDSDK